MNEPEIEKDLRTLTPVAPSSALEKTIAKALAAGAPALSLVASSEKIIALPGMRVPTRPRYVENFGWAAFGAIAASVVFALNGLSKPPTTRPAVSAPIAEVATRSAAPRHVTRELLDAEDAGVVFAAEQPARLVRYSTLERHAWVSKTGARVEVQLPRQDLVLLPLVMQ